MMWPSGSNFDSIWGEDPYQKATNDPMDDDADSAWPGGPGRAGARRLRIKPPGAEAAQAGAASPSSSSRSQPSQPRAAPEVSAMDNFWAAPDNGGGGDASIQESPRAPSQAQMDAAPPAVAAPGQGELINDINNDFCEVCQSGGRLLLCERCPRAFHVRCIERFVDVDAIGQHSTWACPVCRHGVDVFRGQARAQISAQEMQANMEDALRRNRGLRRAAARRRDQFLAAHLDLVEPFATRPALSRIQRILEERALAPLDIGSSVKAAKSPGGPSFDAVVLLQTSMRKYVVADPESKAEVEVDRDNITLLEGGTESRQSLNSAQVNDFLGFAHKPVLSEGTVLKDYQAAGVNWLVHMFYNRCGGILADDMGLGKTIQTLSFLSYLQTSAAVTGPFLVVCPLSCAGNWVREAKRFVPHMSISKVYGASSERKFCLDDDEIWYGQKDIIITTYETICSTADYFARHVWSVIVLDEAHRIKNTESRIREVLDGIECSCRVLLTGTPLQNNLGELFALLRFLWPDVLVKTSDTFESAVRLPGTLFNGLPGAGIAVNEDGKTVVDVPLMERIRSLLTLLMLRRQKEEATSLPPKVFHDIWMPFSPLQVKWYKTILKCQAQAQQKGIRALLKLVLRLRQLSGHPRCLAAVKADREQLQAYQMINDAELAKLSGQFSEEAVAQSGKLAFLDKLLGQLHAQNMGFSNTWRKAFEERQRKSGEDQRRRKHTSAWLRDLDGVHFLDDMRPYRQPSAASNSGSGGAAGGAAGGDEDDLPRPHKVLIFSQFHAVLGVLEEYCCWRGFRYLRLDGSTFRVLRELDMRDFNSCDEDYFIYLIGTRSGGLGVNLASANHVVLFDQDWNPHVDLQAIDRAHRIGQYRRVHVYKLVQEWGVEERLVHRQAQKLKIEQCVIQQDEADGEEAAWESERLSGVEVDMLLRYGAQGLKHFDGECIKDMSLGDLLERKHRPLLKSEGTVGEPEAGLLMGENQRDGFVVDDGDGGSHIANRDKEEEDVPPPPLPKPVPEANPGPVRRTSSGRAVRAPTRVYVPVEIVKKPTVKKDPLKHGRICFACGKGPQPKVVRRRGRTPATEDFSEDEADASAGAPPADTFCSKCPMAYHSACLGPRSKPASNSRWVCSWHICTQCSRTASACGGMLIHCMQCPTALCYDCFPPNFRRVQPSEQFWANLNSRGWKMTPQQMVFFKCNSCRALEEQGLRKQMRAEDLEAQEDERKRAALEEKRNLAATKRQAEAEEARRRLRQVMLDHERSQLSLELQRSRDRVVRAAEILWPPRFWAIWLECCSLGNLGEQLATASVPRRKGCWKANKLELWLQEARTPLAVCANCCFPGHRARQCPLPAERVTGLVSGEEGGGGEEADEDAEKVDGKDGNKGSFIRRGNCYRKVCPLCKRSTHSRVQCQALGAEDRAEYEARCRSFGVIRDALREAAALPEPQLPAVPVGEMPAQQLLEAWRQTEAEVSKRVEALLVDCGLGHLAVRAGAGGRPLGEEVEEVDDAPDNPEEPEPLVPARAKAKAKGRGKARGRGRGRGPGRPRAGAGEVAPRAKSRSGVRKPARPKVEPIDAEEEAEEVKQCQPEEPEVLMAVDDACVISSARGRGRGRGSRGGRRGRPGGSRGRGRGAQPLVAAPKPKAKSTAMAQASHLGGKRKAVEEIDLDGPEAVPRAKGKAKAKAKSQPKVCGQEEERILIDGTAAGWSVRGSVRKDGSSFLSYKPPHSSSWTNPGQVSAHPSITCALEAEARDILQGLRSALGCGPPPVGPRETAPASGSAPGPGAGALAPQGPPAPAQEPARAPDAGPPLGEAREIIRGPAVGWVIRGRVVQNHLVNFTFRRPGSTNWETINEAEGSMTKAARESIEREKLGIQERLLAKLQATLVGGPPGEPGPKDPGQKAGRPGGERHPQTEIMHVVGGIAAGWSVRVTVSPRGACSWDFREPQGIRWRSMKDLRQGSGDPVVCAALEAEQAAMANRFGHPLPSAGKGSGKRRTAPAEKGAFQAAFETPIEGIAEPEMEPAAEG